MLKIGNELFIHGYKSRPCGGYWKRIRYKDGNATGEADCFFKLSDIVQLENLYDENLDPQYYATVRGLEREYDTELKLELDDEEISDVLNAYYLD